MLVIAQHRGQPYERWKTEVEIMLEKEPGDPKIDRLCIICLYEADYNLFLKIMWAHRLVTVAEEQNLFDDSQGGGRPNRTSNDVAVRKMLTYTYSRVTRTNFACMDLDAKSCYDRIVASFALLCSRRFGMPKSACDIHGLTIDQMKHYVRTALGVSKAFFESSPETVLYGSGQGSSGSPSLWIVVSSILFRALEAIVGAGAKLPNPDGSTITTTTTTAFVDDTTNFINSILRSMFDDEYELSNRLQEQTQAWEELLSTSGGKLELPKCLAYLVVYDFVDGEPTQRPKSQQSSEIRIKDSTTGETVTIDIKDPAESHKTLGGWQNPAGNPIRQAKILEQKERKMAAYFSYMRLFKYRVHLAYNSMYTKSLQFPLGVTMMSYDTANRISMYTTRAIIGAMGLNRQAPRAVVFVPASKLGLGLKHHYMVQGTKHVKQLISHVRQQDANGDLYKSILEYSQLLAGTTTPILQYPSRTITYFNDPWVSGLRKFLSESSLNIVIPDLTIPTALREKDIPIMEALLTSKATKNELRYSNQCRLFFQVFWLSEICDPDSKSIEQNFLNFNEIHNLPSYSSTMWPKQPAPSRKAFNAWRKLIRNAFLSEKQVRSRNMKIESPLGKFYNRARHRIWHWEWDGSTTVTQTFVAEKVTIVQKFKASTGRSIIINKTQPCSQVQIHSSRQTIPLKMIRQTSCDASFRKERVAISELSPQQTDGTNNDWERMLLRNHVTIDTTNEAELWTDKNTDFCIGVCAKKSGEQTAFGWAITFRTTTLGRTTKIGVGKVPRTNQHDTLCTGELIALHAALHLLRSLIGKTWITEPATVQISTANSQTGLILSQLWKTGRHNPRWRLNRNWEVLFNIQNDIAANVLEVIDPADDSLAELAQRTAAKALLTFSLEPEYHRRSLLQPTNSTGRAYLRHGLEIINDKYDEAIHERYNSSTYELYVCDKKKWSKQIYKSIEWTAFNHEAKKLNVNERTQLLKFVYGWLPIGKRRQSFDPKACIICPSCGNEEETHDHILQCEEPKRRQIFENLTESIRQQCEKSKVNSQLTEEFLSHLTAWIEKSEAPILPSNSTPLRRALTDQKAIGWNNCMRGFLTIKFQQLINQNKGNPLSKFESVKWTTQIIKLMWQHELDQWKARNEAVHGATKEEQYQKVRERLLEDATELYSYKLEIPEPDRSKIFKNWYKAIKKKNRPLKHWLQIIQRTVHYLLDTSKLPDDDPINDVTETIPSTAPT
jgi:Reverse transcriptase (RNA-dependent DNA polymerase)